MESAGRLTMDSPESRMGALDELKRFAKRVGLEKSDAAKRAEWIQAVDPKKFMDVLSVMNGLLRGQARFARWNGKAVKTVVSMGGSVDLEPPEHAEEEFEKLFRSVQQTIDRSNLSLYAAKLYTGIVQSHMFPDGNGRLARSVYGLLASGTMPDVEQFAGRTRGINEFAAAINNAATASLFQKEGVLADGDFDYRDYFMTTDGISLAGQTDHLAYLAARRVLKKEEGTVPQIVEFNDFTSEQRISYEREYAQIRRDFFWMTQEVVDRYSERVIAMLDEALRGKGRSSDDSARRSDARE